MARTTLNLTLYLIFFLVSTFSQLPLPPPKIAPPPFLFGGSVGSQQAKIVQNKINYMKKMMLHKMPSLKSQEGANGHNTLASALKAIVSGELRLDRGPAGAMETSLSHTGITRKQSAQTKATKGPLNDSNSSFCGRNEESLHLNRKISKEDFSNDRPVACRLKRPDGEDFPQMVMDEVLLLRKEVAEIRGRMYQSTPTDNQTSSALGKPAGSSGALPQTWTQLYLGTTTSEILSPCKSPPKLPLQKRVQILQDIILSNKDRLDRQLPAKLLQAQSQHLNTLKQMTQRLFRVQSQHANIRSDLQNFQVFFPLSKSSLIDQLDREVCTLNTRVEMLESQERRENRQQNMGEKEGGYCRKESVYSRKESLDARREIGELRAEVKAFNGLLGTISEQIERYSNVESQLKELLARQQGKMKLEVEDLAQKVVEIQEYVCSQSEDISELDIRSVKLQTRCEQTASRLPQIQSRLQQRPPLPSPSITPQQFSQALQSLQSQQDSKLLQVILDYNQNFLTIDHTLNDIKDFVQQILMVSRTITQKLQSIWRHQIHGQSQLDEFCKTSGDVYLLLENNIQKICELSKKEMSFEHEVKELKEKMEVVDGGRVRRVGSLNASFCESNVGEMLPSKSRIFNRSTFTSLLDQNIQDQEGQFD